MTDREEFNLWWESFKDEHDEWRFADREAILFAAWQAAQPAEPVALTDADIDAITRDKFGTRLLGVAMAMHREYARAILAAAIRA